MRVDHEEVLARNAMLLARCFWHLSHEFGTAADGRAPSLPLFVIASAMLFHGESVEKIHRMNFDSGLFKVVMERPDLLAGLQRRLEAALEPSLKGLQVAVSSGLLSREGGEGFPTFRAAGSNLPAPLRDPPYHGTMTAAARRLGVWFAGEPLAVIQRQLAVEF
ncbi:three component ABC system middle component [Brevundimonas naejangsanensis]|uniref:three component ABC system middle component n=1 Tax=Brevundimonas naejangsanensis TaxID=588932 RepID=UPI003209724C